MAINYADSVEEKQGGDFELIPDGSLAYGNLIVKPRALENGLVVKKGKANPDNRYLDLMVEITSGPFTGRTIFTMIGVAGSEKWVNMGRGAICRILEVGNNAGPHNPGGYILGLNLPDGDERSYMDLDGMQCAVRIGVEPGKDGYKDKNKVDKFLSPNPDSDGFKDFTALKGGATVAEGVKERAAPKPASTGGNAWEQAPKATVQNGTPPAARPDWTGGAPAPKADTVGSNKAPW